MKNYLEPAQGIVMPPILQFPLGYGPYNPPGNYPFSIASGDVDGDGRDEIVFLNGGVPTLGLLSYFEYGDLSPAWASQPNGQLVNIWSSTNQVPGGWVIQSSDRYLTADLDGDGIDEIVALGVSSSDFNDVNIGVLKFETTALSTLWMENNYLSGTASFYQFYVADVDGDGCDEIVWVNPADTSVGILKWENPALQSFLGPTYWPIKQSDQIFVAKLSASNGDNREHLVVFSPTGLDLQVWIWDGKQFSPPSPAVSKTIPNANASLGGWQMSANDQYTVAAIAGNGDDALVVYNGTSQQLGVVQWDITPARFNVTWSGAMANVVPGNFQSSTTYFFPAKISGQTGEQILVYNQSSGAPGQTLMGLLKWGGSALSGSDVAQQTDLPTWIVGADWMFPLDADGDGNTELGFYNSGSQTLGMLEWDGSTLTSQWAAQNAAVRGFNVDLILAGPKTTFTANPFTDYQLLIYQYISYQLISNNDIRSEYNNPAYAGDFLEFYETLQNPTFPKMAKPTQPDQSDWDADWDTVFAALSNELSVVDFITKWQVSLHYLNGKLKEASQTAMGNAWGNVTQNVQGGNDTVSYSPADILSAVFDATLWGVAAVSGVGKVMQVMLSVGASLYGSFSSALPATPQTIDYPGFWGAINNQYVNLDIQIDSNINVILADEVMLPLFGKLVSSENNGWMWKDSDADAMYQNSIGLDTVHYYTLFIPMRFNMLTFENASTATPYYCFLNSRFGPSTYQRMGINAPDYTYLSQANNGTWNIYLLAAGLPPSLVYPGQQLFTDIATWSLLPSFFQCYGSWSNIKQVGIDISHCS